MLSPSEPLVSQSAQIRLSGVGKTFKTLRRKPGATGILRNFVDREVEEFVALKDIDLEVRSGEFVGLIGANGAGKTTLVKILCGIIPASAGDARLLGRDCFELRDEEKRRISLVMGQRSQLWWDIPAIDSFRLLREIYEVEEEAFERRLKTHAERLGVSDKLDVQLRQLSLGQRMKMEIIGAFLHEPEVVFLDEPTIGLDLVAQETIRGFLRDLNKERGVTIVLTSHDMADIEQTCERLLILEQGSLLFDGDLADLQRRLVGRRAVEVHLEPGSRVWDQEAEEELKKHGVELVRETPLSLSFVVPAENNRAFLQSLFELFDVRDLNIERQPLEGLIREVFRSGGLGEEG
jgi:ABC-2 type transport system ATP-binding protein